MSGLTLPVIVGVSVFVISQYFLKLVLEPIIRFRQVLSDISNTLLFHQGTILSGTAEDEILHRKIHELSAMLRSSVYMIPYYNLLHRLHVFGLPQKENILLSCRKLNMLSYGVKVNSVSDPSDVAEKNEKNLVEISRLLPIETTFMLDEEKNP